MAQRNKINWKGIAVAIGLPLSFFLIAKSMSKDKLHLPGYYVETKDSIRHVPSDSIKGLTPLTAGEFEATNQMGEHVALNRDLQGKILVIDFIFTSCPNICPQLTRNMAQLQKLYHATPMRQNDTIAQFISITVDPERDSALALRAFAQKFGVNSDHWWFLTASKKSVYAYARNSLKVVSGSGDGGADDFMHTQKIVVLDKDRCIRGYYDGLNTLELRRCADDIGWLYVEKKRK